MAKIDLKQTVARKDTGPSLGERLSALMSKDFSFGGEGLDHAFKEQFYSDLHVLISSGLDLRSTLDLVAKEAKEGKAKDTLQRIRKEVSAGRAFSTVLEDVSGFTEYEVHSLRIGEETGAIAEVLENLSNDFRDRIKLRRELITAFSYPIMVSVIAILAVAFMMTFVVPLFSDLFQRTGQELPWLTRQVVALSDFVSSFWWLLLLFLIVVGMSLMMVRKHPPFRSKLDYVLIRIPLLGPVLRESVMARFTGSLSFMLRSNVNLLRSLKLSADMTGFAPLMDGVKRMEEGLIRGENLTELVSRESLFDSRFAALVKVGEEVNQLGRVFTHLSDQYSGQIQRRTKMLSTFLEPLMIAFLGILVGTILVAMYLPLFEMNTGF